MRIKRLFALTLATAMIFTGCASDKNNTSAKKEAKTATNTTSSDISEVSDNSGNKNNKAPEIEGLTYQSAMDLKYAEGFNVYYYEGGYKYIDIPLSGTYLIVPEGKEAPDNLPESDTQVIKQNLSQIYLAASSAMSFFDALDAIDTVTMTGTNTKGWYIDAPKEALANGTMKYTGKYSEPDYEMLVDNDCDIAIESTMILHAPEVQEMLMDLGIPVFIDRSSYELSAFGRIEWIKIYGALLNKEEEADAFFKEQEKILDNMEEYEDTGLTVAFFSINSDGSIVVRKTKDFIPNMIALAGGHYIFDNLENPGSNSASVNISMEDFYDQVVDADFIVYNATIEDPISSVESLIDKDELFKEFKAVKNNNVWQVDKTWYQSTATVANLITDFNIMLTGKDTSKLTFLSKVGE
ncbi:iron complex transport system substrate-binding protein [Acetitomaculum ruminis DSM 5522]|uniref:Iron complex transport system substrate-binding protein n=1 Tax=Acetitomaculum ruminis DSM 5522 TaxID=1120918 RepID=A0A1I0ZNT8_9FIRM|nr:ABC transporter substrate-binding protein [Acetitomaculum ruminis]SFB27374.1 iron complex transport system substrate-binding protein [Acetitomaculum ruminis DSM 5522]